MHGGEALTEHSLAMLIDAQASEGTTDDASTAAL